MKKYKLKPINSYQYYKKSQLRRQRFFTVFCILICTASILTIINYKYVDLKTIFKITENDEIGYTTDTTYNQYDIAYELYNKPTNTKGIYIPPSKVANYEEYIEIARETGINTFVIDVKSDQGYFMFETDNDKLNELGVVTNKVSVTDPKRMMMRLYEEGIYPIARVVAFKDNVITQKQPERAIKSLNGDVYKTRAGEVWLDPYNKDNWEYIIAAGEAAWNMGFKEVQFDYIRFHESMNETNIVMQEDISKTDIISEFVKYSCDRLKSTGLNVSADVFGAVVISDVDANIVGQDFEELSRHLDYISPMVYPSHYAKGTFGIDYPHIDAYDIILNTMNIGIAKIADENNSTTHATIRPWLQDFTLKYLEPYHEYGEGEIRQQIQAAYDAGLSDWMFWNAGGNYTLDGFK